MAENWVLSNGTLEDGSQVIVLADAAYASKPMRGMRETLLAVDFPGTYMLQARGRRDSFLDGMVEFLHAGTHRRSLQPS